jgi:site-specific DNA-methyltransferase (adenine-specific)
MIHRSQLIHGDFLKESPNRLDNGFIDLIVTSPPYNLDVTYDSYQDNLPHEDYLAWTYRWAKEARRVLSEKGSLFLNIGGRPSKPWFPWEVATIFRNHFKIQNIFHWVKSITVPKTVQDTSHTSEIAYDVTTGHYKPVNSERFVNNLHEYIFHFTHQGDVVLDRTAIGVPYQDPSNIARWDSADTGLHCRGNVWFIPYPTIKSREKNRPHPATFPVKLPEMCMRLHGVDRIGRALDPFLGIGSSAIAAKMLGLPFVGFEISDAYINEAHRQLSLI